MKRKLKFMGIVAAVVIALDVLTKWLIVENLALGAEIPVIPNLFDIVHGRNTGAAFGILSDWHSAFKNWFFYLIAVFAAVFLYYYMKSVPARDKISLTALGFILGGALGNLIDRIWRGSVVDFLSFHYYDKVLRFSLFGDEFEIPLSWPAFNLADSAITVAVVLLVVQALRGTKGAAGT